MEDETTKQRFCLGVFAKYWEPGKVKTRLAQSVGEERAAKVYLAFVETLLLRFASTEERRSTIVFSPDERQKEFQQLASATCRDENAWDLVPQGDGDLGERLHRFFADSLAKFDCVVVIGTDSPILPSAYLHQAKVLLQSHDVVLGPSEDGGYYLIGARKLPPVFAGIDWSTSNVWQQTITCLQENRTKFAVLPKWYDVDEIDDLDRLRKELSEHTCNSQTDDEERRYYQQLLDRM